MIGCDDLKIHRDLQVLTLGYHLDFSYCIEPSLA